MPTTKNSKIASNNFYRVWPRTNGPLSKGPFNLAPTPFKPSKNKSERLPIIHSHTNHRGISEIILTKSQEKWQTQSPTFPCLWAKFPGSNRQQCFNNEELKRLFYFAMPNRWRTNFVNSGQSLHTTSLESLKTYVVHQEQQSDAHCRKNKENSCNNKG